MSDKSAKAQPFVPPKVGLGYIVLWKHSASDGEAAPALVVKAGSGGVVSLLVFPPDSRVGFPKDGVLHARDPRVLTRTGDTGGVWFHTEQTEMLIRLFDEFGGEARMIGGTPPTDE